MKKQKSIIQRLGKYILYSFILILAGVLLIMYYNTADSKPISLYDILFICAALFIFDLLSKVENLQNQVDELEGRLEELESKRKYSQYE